MAGATRRPTRAVGAACLFALLGAAPDTAAEGLDWRAGLTWVFSWRATSAASGVGNPDNVILRLPQLVFDNELRPNLRFDYATFQLVIQPSLAFSVSSAWAGQRWSEPQLGIRGEFAALYGSWRVTNFLTLAYGLQNYQWGPAETLSPTNPIFHLPYTRNILTLIRGKHLARVNISPSRSWSIVFLLEPTDNGEPAFIFGSPFDRKGLVKVEYTGPSGDTYVGIAAGKGELSRPWVGEYGVYSITDVLSVYGDARHMVGSDTLYPTGMFEAGRAFLPTDADSGKVRTIAALGARYQFAGGEDVRLEYLHNDPGYDANQIALSARTVARMAAVDPGVIGAYTSPGLDVPGRKYLYASVHLPKLGPHEAVSLSAQYLHSLTDKTGALFVNAEWLYSDTLVLFMSSAAVPGQQDGDLTRLFRGFVLVGGKFSQ